MAVTVQVIGNGHFQGAQSSIAGYTVTEDATPLDGSDTSGGMGTVSVRVVEDDASDGTILLLNDTIELTDHTNGRTQGKVNSVSVENGTADVTADSRLGALVATAKAKPFVGTLENAFKYYLYLAKIEVDVRVDPRIANRAVVYPGWTSDIWTKLKEMCVAEQIEIALVGSNVILRPLHEHELAQHTNSSESYVASNGELAQFIEIYYYNSEYKRNAMVYPQKGWDESLDVLTVDANETKEVVLEVDVSLEELVQPRCVMNIGPEYSGPESVYTVAGSDGLPITPQQWAAQGGSLTVKIDPEDDHKIIVTLVGAQDNAAPEERFAPYSIAVAASASDSYSTLRIMGTGVFEDAVLLTLPTGVPAEKTANKIGVTVDNPYIRTMLQAYDVGIRTAQAFGGADISVSVSATVVNRKGDDGILVRYPTFEQFDATVVDLTFAQFDTAWRNKTFAEFDTRQFELVADNFVNQAFGNVAGARVPFRDHYYRVRSATITESNISYSADQNTLFGDFDDVWDADTTFGDFDDHWKNKTLEDFELIPLWRAPIKWAYVPPVTTIGYGLGGYGNGPYGGGTVVGGGTGTETATGEAGYGQGGYGTGGYGA